jgi:hypothetical protein
MTAIKSIVAAALMSAAFVAPAFARDVYTVKLEAPVSEQTRVIAINTIWDCSGDTCLARADHGASVRACRQFVREAGARVSAYGSADRQLSADEITRCNRDAPETQQAAN